MSKVKTHIAFLFLLLAALSARAQMWLGKSDIGFTIGGMNYIGDLNNQSMFGTVNLAYGGMYRLNFDERWSMRIDIDYGHVEGGNPDYIARRNLSFHSYIFEGALRAEFNFFPFSMRDDHYVWTPYIFAGLGFFAYNPKAYFTDPLSGESDWYELQPLGTEGQGSPVAPDRTPYTLKQLAMPFGIGFKYHPSKSFTLSVEYGFRKTWTDYIDDVSTTYVDNEQLAYYMGEITAGLADRSSEVEPGYVNAAGMKRGDDSLDDWFAYFNVSFTVSLDFIFGWMLKKKCDNK
ncbi:MAG: outer membrane beta-barrel protein [Bacteroidales bacterium]|nr:outer membrane beta-barrel protein [Bacteroidales bacterium]